MLISAIADVLSRSSALSPFWAKLDAGEDAALGIAHSARPLLVASRFARVPQPTLVVVAGEEAADDFARALSLLLGTKSVIRYPDRADKPWDDAMPDPGCISARMRALDALKSGADAVVVASARSLMRYTAPAATSPERPIRLICGMSLSEMDDSIATFDDFTLELEQLGYRNMGRLDGPGSYTATAGTVDVHPGGLEYPVRLDFFGDELEDMRRIVPSTMQTISSFSELDIYPVSELRPSRRALARARAVLHNPAKTNPTLRQLLEKAEGGVGGQKLDGLLPYLYQNPGRAADFLPADALVALVEPRSLIDDALHAFDEFENASVGTSVLASNHFEQPSKLGFGQCQQATYQSIMSIGSLLDAELPVKRTEVAGDADKLIARLRSFVQAGHVTLFSVPQRRVREDMKLDLVDHGIPIVDLTLAEEREPSLEPGVVTLCDMDVPLGMVLPKAGFALVSISDVQGVRSFVPSRHVDLTEVTFPYSVGDYVVHAAHGVALFRDIVRMDVDGVGRDYLHLEYAEQDKLYVPVEQLDRVTRYVGPEGASPKLTRLNTSDWSRCLSRARKASRKLAFDLVDVYTRRIAASGYAYQADTPWQRQMEEDFPYAETPDQANAIAEVKADMQSARPMDRLICGDVGFGKTEVALRAAFKATQDGKQVMVLCPTTILAQQHFTTFSERFEPYGVSVDVLSRFRTPAQQQATLEGFAKGEVAVLVGTHRLLSRDVNPSDLGLVIIDEEQRFGVGHKEQLKNLREFIDVLTLSATPIPRTLQMSLSGVRDMSLILTPPDERRPVKVSVGEWDPDVVAGAIEREVQRAGQVYYVSNRVHGIEDVVERLKHVAPSARIGVAHGQMGKEELERVMEDFSAGMVDVLVATTIIESGIDNPHTNTLIIEDAQRLGLAQMYQLKGRVGRSSTQAYAYFMFPEKVMLTEEAMARLTAINEFQDLGSGMRVAMRDLEIRGAGNILGAEQSGNISAVGFDLFAQMLASAVAEEREGRSEGVGYLPSELSEVSVNVPEHAYIPEEYIADGQQRVLLYRKVAMAQSVQDIEQLYAEMESAHGVAPAATRNFFAKAKLKALSAELGVKTISCSAGKVSIEPMEISDRELLAHLKKAKVRYLPNSRKLQVPLGYFGLLEDGSITEAIGAFLKDLAPTRSSA